MPASSCAQNTSLDAIVIIRLYGLRFKIEHTFKQAVRQIGSFTYHFWMSNMKPLRRNSGNQHLHHTSLDARNDVKRKLHAYHVFIQAGIICQGLLPSRRCSSPARLELFRLLAANHSPRHPALRARRRHHATPEPPEFLLNTPKSSIFTKFATERQDTNKMQAFRLAA